MKFVVVGFPFFNEFACRVLTRVTSLPDVKVAAVTLDPLEALPQQLWPLLCGHWRLEEMRDPDQMRWALSELSKLHGPIHRLFSPVEHVQIVCARMREELGLPGMSLEATLNFRDKARMKDLFDRAGIPC